MSAHAITVRLRLFSQLRRLCLSLGRAGRAGASRAAEPGLEPASPTEAEALAREVGRTPQAPTAVPDNDCARHTPRDHE
jgi:hypothetical protein